MNATRIVVAGAGGRLGAAVLRHFRGLGADATGLDRRAMDLGDPGRIGAVLAPLDFDLLVNCAAVTSVDYCEGHEDEAMAVNGEAPGVMARICAEKGARMAHVGTDYVYAGDDPGLKGEGAPVEPLGVYARSKFEGDERVLAVSPEFLVLRTAWVFGPDRAGFIDSILQRALEADEVEAIDDKVSSVCSSVEFGRMLEPLLGVAGAGGVVNLCQRGVCSWWEFASHGLEVAREAGIEFRAAGIGKMRLAEMEVFEAPRPRYTGMDTGRFSRLTGMLPVAWEEAVASYVRDIWVPRARGRKISGC